MKTEPSMADLNQWFKKIIYIEDIYKKNQTKK